MASGSVTITLSNIGDKVYFRGDNDYIAANYDVYTKTIMTGSIAASGNIMSLLDKTCERTTLPNYYAFCRCGRMEED